MGRFAKKDPVVVAQKQAANIMKTLQGTHLKSVGTVNNYEAALSRVAQFVNREMGIGLRDMTAKDALTYLDVRSEEVGQKTLDMERQAIQAMLQYSTKRIPEGERLPVVKSEHQQILKSRAYTPEQVRLVAEVQQPQNALSTQLAHAAGLRAHELFTLRPAAERQPNERPARAEKFAGREGQLYTVQGKGGLIRHVLIPNHLVTALESRRLNEPQRVTDRKVHYTQRYDISAGKNWSQSFSRAANKALGWCEGAHGVRHSYAQERMTELLKSGLLRSDALEIVSQEMGHFRPEITETYLR